MNNSKKGEAVKNNIQSDISAEKKPREFVLGLATFAVFVIFMAAWMYFSV